MEETDSGLAENSENESKRASLYLFRKFYRKNRPQIILVSVFLFLQLAGVFLAYTVSHSPEMKEYMEINRPPAFNPDSGEETVINIVSIGVIGTIVLLSLKKFHLLKLKYIVMIAVFGAGSIVAGIFTDNILLTTLVGLFLLAIRHLFDSLSMINFSVIVSVLGFGAMGQYIEPVYAIILLFLLSIYDIIGVLYTKHITYLWFGTYVFDTKWRAVLAFIMPVDEREVIMVGAGDFAFPLLLTFSSTKYFVENSGSFAGIVGGLIIAVGTTLGFAVLQHMAAKSEQSKTTGLPGLPFVTIGGVIGYIFARLLI